MTNELFIKIVLLLISIVLTMCEIYVLPYVKSRMTATELDQLNWYIQCAVRCAEQIFTSEQWKEKKEYVMKKAIDFVNDTLKIELSESDIDTIVEGIVNEIKH